MFILGFGLWPTWNLRHRCLGLETQNSIAALKMISCWWFSTDSDIKKRCCLWNICLRVLFYYHILTNNAKITVEQTWVHTGRQWFSSTRKHDLNKLSYSFERKWNKDDIFFSEDGGQELICECLTCETSCHQCATQHASTHVEVHTTQWVMKACMLPVGGSFGVSPPWLGGCFQTSCQARLRKRSRSPRCV